MERLGENRGRSPGRAICDRGGSKEPLLEEIEGERRYRSLAKAHQPHSLQAEQKSQEVAALLPCDSSFRQGMVSVYT